MLLLLTTSRAIPRVTQNCFAGFRTPHHLPGQGRRCDCGGYRGWHRRSHEDAYTGGGRTVRPRRPMARQRKQLRRRRPAPHRAGTRLAVGPAPRTARRGVLAPPAGMRQTAWYWAKIKTWKDRVMANSTTLKVRVNRDKCQGHNRCKAIAPELFELDEFGNAHEVNGGLVPPELEEKAYLAKSNCPEFAVEIIEK